jgi:hypothetical protein
MLGDTFLSLFSDFQRPNHCHISDDSVNSLNDFVFRFHCAAASDPILVSDYIFGFLLFWRLLLFWWPDLSRICVYSIFKILFLSF